MDLGELVVSLRLRTESLEKGLNETKKKLDSTQKAMKEQAKAATDREREIRKAAQEEVKAAREAKHAQDELASAYTKTSAIATAVFAGVVIAIKSGIDAYNEYTSVMKGFENQIKATGQSIHQAKEAMTELSSDGLISEADSAAAIKNLVNYGFTIEKARKTLQALKDTAVDNRQAHYNLGEAVRVTTEGIRMENSVLSDAAGVQKNIAKMKENYAKSLGKTVDALTTAERAEAIYQGVMEESTANMGRAAEYASELGGQQAQLAASTQKLAQGFGASMAPAMSVVIGLFQPLLNFVVNLTKEYPALTSAVTALVLVFSGSVAVYGAVAAAKLALAAATGTLGVALSTLMLNPIVLGLAALAAVAVAVTTSISNAKKATEELKQAQEEYQAVVDEGISKNEIPVYEEKIQKLTELKEKYQELIDTAAASDAAMMGNNLGALHHAADQLNISLEELEQAARDFGVELEYVDDTGKLSAKTMAKLEEVTKTYTKAVKDASRATTEEVNDTAKQIAMKNREAMEIDNLLKQYRSAKKGSSEWNQAQSELAKMFPQFSSAIGINADAIEGLLIVKKQEIETSWKALVVKAQEIITEKKREVAVREAAIAAIEAGAKWIFGMDNAAAATRRAREEVEKLKGEIVALEALATTDPSKVAGVDPVIPYTPKEEKPKAAKAYENKALDEAYKLLEHKKKLNQLTLEDELKTLESIKAKHVKTADERMEIEERIYDVKISMGDKALDRALKTFEREKELGKLSENDEIVRLGRIKKLYADSAEDRERLDDMIFDATRRKIEAEKTLRKEATDYAKQQLQAAYEDRLARENLTAEESFKVHDKLINDQIWLNNEYLRKVLADDRYTAAEKRQIEREITEEIRQQTNERLTLQKNYAAEVRQQQIDEINNLSKGIQDALKAKYQAEKDAEDSRIKESLSALEEWRKAQIDIIKSSYDARIQAAEEAANREIELINETLNAQIKAIEDELKALDEAEKQKNRDELDAEDEKKINKLKALIEYEKDGYNREQLEKELQKALAEQAARHEKEKLDDKKEALKDEMQEIKDQLKDKTQAIKDELAEKKKQMQAAREAEITQINFIAEQQKAHLNKMLAEHQAHYAKLLSEKALQAEAEKMIVNNQQKEIIELLKGFGDSYNATGQSLGQKMYEGFKDRVMQIQTLIHDINRQINAARNAALAAMSAASASAAATTGGAPASSRSMSQTVIFQQSQPSPSEAARQVKQAGKQLLWG